MSDFELHPRLAADTSFVEDWALSRVLLMNDVRYPWIILVPRHAGAVELFDLSVSDRSVLMDEITQASRRLKSISSATKINVAALGNLVPQLHIHVIGRNPTDPAWPRPVWGYGAAIPYAGDAQAQFIAAFVNAS